MCLFVLFVVASASSFSAFYEKWHFREAGGRGFDPYATFGQIVDGTAYRPYVFRRLLPDIANTLANASPVQSISHHVPELAKQKISKAFDLLSKPYPAQYLIVYIATYLAALLATFALYGVCRAANLSPPVSAFTTVVFMLLFPLFGVKGGYFFDYPELLFMAAAVLIALKVEWWWLIPIAALGTWNKESFLLFVIALYPILRRRHSRNASIIAICVLVMVCAAVYLPVKLHYAHNPGSTVEFHLRDQISFYLHPFAMDTWIDRTYDLMFPALSSPLSTLLLIWLVWRTWPHLPTWLKRHGQIAAVINFPLFFLFCQPGEFRDLSLLYICFFFILAIGLQRWMQQFPEPSV